MKIIHFLITDPTVGKALDLAILAATVALVVVVWHLHSTGAY